jgi:hypothetical protein
MNHQSCLSLLGVTLLGACIAVACGASGGSSDSYGSAARAGFPGAAGDGDSSVAGASGEGGQSGDAGQGGSAAAAGGPGGAADAGKDGPWYDVDFRYDAPERDGALTQDSACVTATAEARVVPLDIYLMQDSTGSMSTSSMWDHCVTAINGFVQSSTQMGNRLALQFFDSDLSDDCSGGYYSNPDVPLTGLPVPAGSNPISTALSDHGPGGLTPTEGALQGIIQFTVGHKSPGRAIIGILVTDGDPTDCETSTSKLKNLISSHVQSTQIKIFVVGMTGATFDNLEDWAEAGGAQQHTDYCSSSINPCHFYNIGTGDPQAFLAALQQISQKAIACTYQMPTSDAGTIDPEKVSIEYTPGGQTVAQTLSNVGDPAKCAAGGWYYDNPLNPSTISFCPETCTTVQSDEGAKIQIMLGCLGA